MIQLTGIWAVIDEEVMVKINEYAKLRFGKLRFDEVRPMSKIINQLIQDLQDSERLNNELLNKESCNTNGNINEQINSLIKELHETNRILSGIKANITNLI